MKIVDANGTQYVPVTKRRRRITVALAIAAAPFIIALMGGAGMGIYDAATHRDDANTVRDFNAGFGDAQRDNCEQGFAPACEWLAHTR